MCWCAAQSPVLVKLMGSRWKEMRRNPMLTSALHYSQHGCSVGRGMFARTACSKKLRSPWAFHYYRLSSWLLWLEHYTVSPQQLFRESRYLLRSLGNTHMPPFCKYLLAAVSESLQGLCELVLWGQHWTARSGECRLLSSARPLGPACSSAGRSRTGVVLFLCLAQACCIMW